MTEPTPAPLDAETQIVNDADPDDPKIRAAHERLVAKLTADPDSTEGVTSYADGQSPDELAAAAPDTLATPTTDIQRIEQELGFTFSAPGDTVSPPPNRTVICRDPECPNRGEQIAVHTDTPQPIHCGGCGIVLLCDHTTETTEQMTGTLAAPVKITTERCTRCGTITHQNKEPQPPVNLADLPIGILEAIGQTPGDTTFTGGASAPA